VLVRNITQATIANRQLPNADFPAQRPTKIGNRQSSIGNDRCYISSVEVARQFKNYRRRALSRKFAITAAIVIVVAAIFGGTIGSARRFSSLTSLGAKVSYRVADEIVRDYN
jgi:hypothetical protein